MYYHIYRYMMKQKAIIKNRNGKEFQYITQLPNKTLVKITIPYSVVNMTKKTKIT